MSTAGALLTLLLSVLGVIGLFFLRPLIAVGEGEVVVLERWRRFSRLLRPGLNAFMPLLDWPRYVRWQRLVLQQGGGADEESRYTLLTLSDCRLPLSTQWHALAPVDLVTRDGAEVTLALQYSARLVEAQLERALYTTDDPYRAARGDVTLVSRDLIAQLTLQEVREGFSARLTQALRARKADWDAFGMHFCRLQLDTLEFAEAPEALAAPTRQYREQERLEELQEAAHRNAIERARLVMLKELELGDTVLAALLGGGQR